MEKRQTLHAPRLPPHARRLSTLDPQLSTQIALMTIVMVYHDNEHDDNRTYDAEGVLPRLRKTLQNKSFHKEFSAANVDVS